MIKYGPTSMVGFFFARSFNVKKFMFRRKTRVPIDINSIFKVEKCRFIEMVFIFFSGFEMKNSTN